MNREILLPMADHTALATKREKQNRQIPNPFTPPPDIRVLLSEEYAVAMRGRDIIREMTGYAISADEVGFLAIHIQRVMSPETL